MTSKKGEIEEAIVYQKLELLREFCWSHHGDIHGDMDEADQKEMDVKCDDFCKAFELCTTIENLYLHHVKCTAIGSANTEKIVNVVSRSKSLMYLAWEFADISDQDAAGISRAFSKHCNLEYLSLDDNNIGDSGAKEIASMIGKTRIKKLYLSVNCIGDSGAKDIATMLTRNNIIEFLDLRGNSYGDSGARYLVDALLQNHKCKVDVSVGAVAYLWSDKNMETEYLSSLVPPFSKYDCVTQMLSNCNSRYSPYDLEKVILRKSLLLLKARFPSNKFERWYSPVFSDFKKDIILHHWETALEEVNENVMLQAIRKRKEIDLSNRDDVQVEPDGSGAAIQNQIKQRDEYSAQLKKVKVEKVSAENALAEAKEDVEDANELVQQQSLFTDKWQTKFDDLAKLAEEVGVDLQQINEIRYR